MPATTRTTNRPSPKLDHAPAHASSRRKSSRWKLWSSVFLVSAALMILTPRLWVKNKNAHMVYAGRVTTGFHLYHGWGNRFLITLSEGPDAGTAALIDPSSKPPTTYFCRRSDYFALKLFVLGKTLPAGCTRSPSPDTTLSASNLTFRSASGAAVEVTWERPW